MKTFKELVAIALIYGGFALYFYLSGLICNG